jgi:hypothetical protein
MGSKKVFQPTHKIFNIPKRIQKEFNIGKTQNVCVEGPEDDKHCIFFNRKRLRVVVDIHHLYFPRARFEPL